MTGGFLSKLLQIPWSGFGKVTNPISFYVLKLKEKQQDLQCFRSSSIEFSLGRGFDSLHPLHHLIGVIFSHIAAPFTPSTAYRKRI